MRNMLALGAAILVVGFVGVSFAQERLQSNQSGMGVGEGVGDVSGSSTRVTTFDRTQFLDRLSQPETVYGRVFALDLAQHRLMIETGGAGKTFDEGQEGKSGYGARTVMTLLIDEHSNMQSLKLVNVGDDVSIQVREQTTVDQPFGTGKKLVLEAYVVHVDATKQGFGGLDSAQTLRMSARLIRIVAGSPAASLALCFQERSIPVSPARLVNIPVLLPAGSVNHSQDGAMQSATSQTTGRTTPSQTWSRA